MKILLFIIRWLAQLNYKYDIVKEPKRIFIAMATMFPFILADVIAILTDSKFFNILGLIWIILLIGMRLWYLLGNMRQI